MVSLQWHYLDSQGSEFGPFDSEKMRGWYDQGYFAVAGDSLLVRLPEWSTHQRLGELYDGERANFFVTAPRDSSSGSRDRSRSPRRPTQSGERSFGADSRGNHPFGPYGHPPAPGPGGFPPMPPFGYPPAPGWMPPGPWGHHPPPPGHPFPWGMPPPPGPYGWPPPPPGYRGGPHPLALDYDRDRSYSRSPSPRRRRGGGGGGGRNSAEAAARAAEEAAEQLRRLGRDGLRELLMTTLESLYKDRIKPMANYIKGRLKERSAPEAVIRSFTDLYREHSDLFEVQSTPGSEEVTFLLNSDPAWFAGWIDIDSSEDPYEESMWEAFKVFLDGGHHFAGGRYGMARELMTRNLDFLSAFSLGEVCHIVQLAIQHRKIIVYHKKMLKPMAPTLSQTGTTSAGGNGTDLEEITTLLQLCKVIFKTLRAHPSGLRLDRMKQMIKEECNVRLNEMAFACTKLIELFRQDPLTIAFTLENDGKAFHVRACDPRTFPHDVRRAYDEVYSR